MTELFNQLFINRYVEAAKLKQEGKRIIGYICTQVPEEIIAAAGMVPFRLFGGVDEKSHEADACLYSTMCSFVRSCLQEGISNNYSFLDGIVACNNCDHVRRFFEAWKNFVPSPSFTYILSFPFTITPASLDFFAGEIGRFKQELESQFGVKITEADLQRAIKIYNETRVLLKQLYGMRASDPPMITGTEALKIVRASMIVPKERFNILLREFMETISSRPPRARGNGRVRLMVSGPVLDHAEFIEIIEDMGGIIVADDLCVGARYFWDLVEETVEPLQAIAKRYLTKIPCPRMFPSAGPREENLKEIVKTFNIKGVIYQTIKFCEPYSIHYPLAVESFNRLNLPHLALEREYSLSGVGQIRTRVQAFLETLR
jgi:bzd-type benzoyl-CoA reductase N subunit